MIYGCCSMDLENRLKDIEDNTLSYSEWQRLHPDRVAAFSQALMHGMEEMLTHNPDWPSHRGFTGSFGVYLEDTVRIRSRTVDSRTYAAGKPATISNRYYASPLCGITPSQIEKSPLRAFLTEAVRYTRLWPDTNDPAILRMRSTCAHDIVPVLIRDTFHRDYPFIVIDRYPDDPDAPLTFIRFNRSEFFSFVMTVKRLRKT